ncbi:hypothetical protein Csa_023587, partial [Cucumis sativus]
LYIKMEIQKSKSRGFSPCVTNRKVTSVPRFLRFIFLLLITLSEKLNTRQQASTMLLTRGGWMAFRLRFPISIFLLQASLFFLRLLLRWFFGS